MIRSLRSLVSETLREISGKIMPEDVYLIKKIGVNNFNVENLNGVWFGAKLINAEPKAERELK